MDTFMSQKKIKPLNSDIYSFESHGVRSHTLAPRIKVDELLDINGNKYHDHNIYITLVPAGNTTSTYYGFIVHKSLFNTSFTTELLLKLNNLKKQLELIESSEQIKEKLDDMQYYLEFNFLKYGISHILYEYRETIFRNIQKKMANFIKNDFNVKDFILDDETESTLYALINTGILQNIFELYNELYPNENPIVLNEDNSNYTDVVYSILDYYMTLFSNNDLILSLMNEYLLDTDSFYSLIDYFNIEIKIYISGKNFSLPLLSFDTNLFFNEKLGKVEFNKSGLIKIDPKNKNIKLSVKRKISSKDCNEKDNTCTDALKAIDFMYSNSIFPKTSTIITKFNDFRKTSTNTDIRLPPNKYSMVSFLKELYKKNIKNNIVIINTCNSYTNKAPSIAKLGRTLSIKNRDEEIDKINEMTPSSQIAQSINTTRDEIINSIVSSTSLELQDDMNSYETVRQKLLYSKIPIVYRGVSYEPSFFALSEDEYMKKYLKYKMKYLQLKQSKVE